MSEPAKSRAAAGRAVPGWLVLLLWVLTFTLSYVGVGPVLGNMIEGVDRAQIPKTLALLACVSLLVALVATVLWARGLGRGATTLEARPKGIGRRRFLVGAATSVGGLVGTVFSALARPSGWMTVVSPAIQAETPSHAPRAQAKWKGSRIQAYRRLGRTEFRVSDISLGSGRINLDNDGEAIARAAIERGVNYFDTAPDYSGFGSELALGRAMKGQRDGMFVATKFCTKNGHLNVGASVRQYMEAVEGSLERLQTDYVDLVHVHACDSVERLLDANAHEAFDRLREQGKARFLGVSSHTPDLEKVATAALDSGRFDVMMLAYHHGAFPNLEEIIARAAAANIGIVAMKTLKGAKHRGLLELRDQADSYTQAAFKWVLSSPDVACLVISFYEHQHLDEYLYASGKSLRSEELALLERYDELIAGKHCFTHCGACLASCPEQLAIHDVLRHRMYFEDYGDQKEAMRLYAKLPKQADVCIGCSAPCLGVCPHSVPIKERTLGAHRMLTFS
jgi:predicted aldo/keto reductase-like oxidoreductase